MGGAIHERREALKRFPALEQSPRLLARLDESSPYEEYGLCVKISNMMQKTNYDPPYVLSLDIGTSSTRAILFDARGKALPGIAVQRHYPITTSAQGEASVDADLLVELVAGTIDEALAKAGLLAQQIAAVATDTFWHSLLALDASGRPLTPVITWEDTRPFDAAAQLRSTLDEIANHARTGARFHASYWPAKLRWLATAQPENFQRADQLISFGEYLHRRFLGRSICSLSMASGTGLLSAQACTWDTKLIASLGIRPEQLPQLGDLNEGLQGLTSQYAARWPSLHTIPWFPALGDGATACIGSGCTTPQHWSLTIGTSSAMRVVVSPEHIIPPPALWLYRIDRERGVLGGALSEGGNLLAWLNKRFQQADPRQIDALVEDQLPAAHGLTILPFIAGERSPGWHSDARMTIAGITLHTSPAELLRAAMESLAYQLYTLYEKLSHTLAVAENKPDLIASGGALLGSPVLQSIVADTLDLPLFLSLEQEASARGSALLALEALHLIPDIARVSPTLTSPVLPDSERGAIYRRAAQRQRQLYELLFR